MRRAILAAALLAFAAPALANTIAATDANVFYAPLCWDKITSSTFTTNGTSAANAVQSAVPGCAIKLAVTGTASISGLFDTSTLSGLGGSTPVVAWRVNGGTWGSATLSGAGSTQTVSFATGLASGATNTLELIFVEMADNAGARWSAAAGTSPVNIVRITGFPVDAGGISAALPAGFVRPNALACIGDSIAEGVSVLGSTNYPNNDSRNSSCAFIAQAFNAEPAPIAYGAQGLQQSGQGSIPGAATGSPMVYSQFTAGRAKDWTGINIVLLLHGTNDGAFSDASEATALQSLMADIRSRAGNGTMIVVATPPGGFKKSALDTGFNAYAAANPGDRMIARVDIADRVAATPFANTTTSDDTTDKLHPTLHGNAMLAAAYVNRIQALIQPVAPITW